MLLAKKKSRSDVCLLNFLSFIIMQRNIQISTEIGKTPTGHANKIVENRMTSIFIKVYWNELETNFYPGDLFKPH